MDKKERPVKAIKEKGKVKVQLKAQRAVGGSIRQPKWNLCCC